jgi:hypothetical protein
MIGSATLPATIDPDRYHKNYVVYFGNVLAAAGACVSYQGHSGDRTCGQGLFRATLDGRDVVVDYSDHVECCPCEEGNLPRFKYSYSRCHLPPDGKVFPFSPMSFMDWTAFDRAKREITYRASGRILFVQSPHRGTPCYERRILVSHLLREKFGDRCDVAFYPLEDYWKQINTCLVRVFAPGTRNDMLDRGHGQYMALGCCTISPPLATVLPGYVCLEPWEHYVPCEPDYSDVCEKVRWCEAHRAECLAIGARAAAVFGKCSTPAALVGWIEKCLMAAR